MIDLADCTCTFDWEPGLPHHASDGDPRGPCVPGCIGCLAERNGEPVGRMRRVTATACLVHGLDKRGLWKSPADWQKTTPGEKRDSPGA